MTDRSVTMDPAALVDEDMICRLVHTFYARARLDPDLGPIFDAAVHDWEAHLDKICAFWSSVILRTGRFRGTPMKAHVDLPGPLTRAHFERWLALFGETADVVCPPAAAAIFRDRAGRIAESLHLGITVAHSESIVPRREI
jgi:hemoglobin